VTLTINDTGEKTKLIITNGDKVLLKRKGKSLISLLRFVMENTSKQNVKDSILSLEKILPLMRGSVTKIQIKED